MSRYDEYYTKTKKLFSSCQNAEKRKKLYHELVKKFHTDYNPNADADLIKAINDAYHLDYENIKKEQAHDKNTASSEQKTTDSFRQPKTSLHTEAEVDEEIRFYQSLRHQFVNQYDQYKDKMNAIRNNLIILESEFRNVQNRYLFYKRQHEKDVEKYPVVKFPHFLRPFAKLYQIGKNKYPNIAPLVGGISVALLLTVCVSQTGILFFLGICLGTITFESILHIVQQNSWLDQLKRLQKQINSNQFKYQQYEQITKDYKNKQNHAKKELLHCSFQQNIIHGKIDQCDAILYDLFQVKESFSKTNEKYRNHRQNSRSNSDESSKKSKTQDKGYQKRKKYDDRKGGNQ